MKSFKKFILITLAVLVLSSVLAPILHNFLPFKFEKIFNRIIMISTLVLSAIFVRLDFRRMKELGLVWSPWSSTQLLVGFAGGVVILSALTLIKISAGVAYWDLSRLSAGVWIYKYVIIVLTGLLIGTIEEFFFRGIVYRSLREKAGWNMIAAVLVTSVFYSAVHFVNVEKPYIGPDPGFMDSLKLIAAPFKSFANWPEFWRGAVGLFIFGIVLNLLSIQSRRLWMSIGLHAGCVFFVKMDGHYVEFVNDFPLVWGSGKMYDSIAGWIALALLGVVLWAAAVWAGKKETSV